MTPRLRSIQTGGRSVVNAGVLDEVAAFVGRYVVFPSEHCLPVVTLWAAHTWAADTFYVTPRLVLDSPEPGSGKSRVLELLNLFCRHPELILSPTTAAIFRMLAERPYSLLFDETDAIFDKKNSGNYEDLRALLNAGYKRGATIPRCVGDAKSMKVQRFKVFAPVALAGLAGNMPATITTRAITIHMRRRAPGEPGDDWDGEYAERDAKPLSDELARWVGSLTGKLQTRPTLPDGVVDRAAEIWRPLIALADAAGGEWPDRARTACRHFALNTHPADQSRGVRLLSDLRDVFGADDKLSTEEVIIRLAALVEAPWGNYYGRQVNARDLATLLHPYGVGSTKVKIGTVALQGYRRDHLYDPWMRYLGTTVANTPEPAEPAELPWSEAGSEVPDA